MKCKSFLMMQITQKKENFEYHQRREVNYPWKLCLMKLSFIINKEPPRNMGTAGTLIPYNI